MLRNKIVYVRGKKKLIKDFSGMHNILPGRKKKELSSKDYDLLKDHATYLNYKYVETNYKKK